MKYILVAVAVLLLGIANVAAQIVDCPAIVEDGLTSTANSCVNLGSNEICFGHADVNTIVNCEEAPEFNSPGDIVSLNTVCAMRLGAMQPSGEWGVAMMTVGPSNYPADMTYVLFGDIEIQNAASAVFALRVWVTKDTEIHDGPGSQFGSIGTLNKDAIVEANACNCTGNWLRIVMSDGHIGWISSIDVSVLGETAGLPVVEADTPVYEGMQAFTFQGNDNEPACSEAPEDGILIQTPLEMESVDLQINGVAVTLTSTIFVQSIAGRQFTVETLDGHTRVATDGAALSVPAGMRITIPLTADNLPIGDLSVVPYAAGDVSALPITLLPRTIDPLSTLGDEVPHIVGVDACAVVSDRGETICPLYFVNADGDSIARMDAEFVRAAQGEWSSNFREAPAVIDGDNISGTLAWGGTCSLGGANFIGPVVWSITITDEHGHISEPFEASFNCVEG